ncbi:flagellar export protein FliJ [Alkalilimnicola sp. S0819]|uniref:flagellar export protein FliJ n=1 Tax=Alkalilimnicola sp. S0819 TaxID=2613922 RepID=UPI001261E3A8|nr:flagellar export protein FliJ [Alkalilimnicola sp. S0819]KAB7627178.1 flagellar export protein FliJ [Alkalilimnicola sp. S0819]MPQ15890.1 flagellar export protein FliJ [Alkalilimnicola sp. S0819]
MSRAKRMQPVAELADKKADDAARALAEQRRRVDEQRNRLEQLQIFRNEYRAQLRSNAELGIDAHRLRDYHAFIARIDGAIRQQESAVERVESQLPQYHGRWAEAWGRAKALNRVVETHRHNERRSADKREQQTIEEMVRRPGRGLGEE